jgi:hypothetical protein
MTGRRAPARAWAVLLWDDGTTEPKRFTSPAAVLPPVLAARGLAAVHDGCGGLVTVTADGAPVRCRACGRCAVRPGEVTARAWHIIDLPA